MTDFLVSNVTFLVFFNQSTLTLQIAWFVFFFVSCFVGFSRGVCMERGKGHVKIFFTHFFEEIDEIG